LGVQFPALACQGFGHGRLEGAFEAAQAALAGLGQGAGAPLGELQEVLQVAHAQGLGARQIHLLALEAGEHPQLVPGAGDGHVQAALTTRRFIGPKFIDTAPCQVRPVGDREVHDVAFVALHAFQVLDENGSSSTSEK
jgi:hypothetical protein